MLVFKFLEEINFFESVNFFEKKFKIFYTMSKTRWVQPPPIAVVGPQTGLPESEANTDFCLYELR